MYHIERDQEDFENERPIPRIDLLRKITRENEPETTNQRQRERERNTYRDR